MSVCLNLFYAFDFHLVFGDETHCLGSYAWPSPASETTSLGAPYCGNWAGRCLNWRPNLQFQQRVSHPLCHLVALFA